MEKIVEVKNLVKYYHSDSITVTALSKIELNVFYKEFIALMGASGCGKSTLLNILGLLDKPDDGFYEFMGIETTNNTEAQNAKLRKGNIGFIYQSFNLIEDLTIQENIELPLLYLKVKPTLRRKKVSDIMSKLNIEQLSKRYPYQVSGGEQQRAAICRAICFEPKIILADEPTGNLDLQNSIAIMQILKELNEQGITIILVTHEPYCAKYAGRIIRMSDGTIIKG